MSKLAIAAASLVAVGGIWWLTRGGETASPARSGSGDVEEVAARTIEREAPPRAAESGSVSFDRVPDVAAVATHPDGGPTIAGRVELPIGAPADALLEVVALQDASTYAELVRGARPVIARAPVETDGRFRIGLPEGAGRAHLMARGRFLYTPSSVEAEANGREAELRAKSGSWVRVEVSAPAPRPAPEASVLFRPPTAGRPSATRCAPSSSSSGPSWTPRVAWSCAPFRRRTSTSWPSCRRPGSPPRDPRGSRAGGREGAFRSSSSQAPR